MNVNYLEIYPSETWCVQWCSHCFRSKGAQKVEEISTSQRGIIDGVLGHYTKQKVKKWFPLHVNLAWDIANYTFQLFDDIWKIDIDRLYFSMWRILESSGKFENLDDILTNLLWMNSWKEIELIANATMNGRDVLDVHKDVLQRFLSEYFDVVQNSNSWIFKKSAALASLWVNNLHERQMRKLDMDVVMNSFFLAHKGARINHEFALWERHDFVKEGMYTLNSDVFWAEFSTQLNVRIILAKRAMRQSSQQALEEALSEKEFLVSVFPDTVMIHHSTETIHVKELYFTYDEFFDILSESSARFSLKRRWLDAVIAARLQERLQNLS